jgi:hypothetical protein
VVLAQEKELVKEVLDGEERGLGRDEGVPVGSALGKGQEGAREVPVLEARGEGLELEGEAVGVVLAGVALVQPQPGMLKTQNPSILRKPGIKDTKGESCYRWRFFLMAGWERSR